MHECAIQRQLRRGETIHLDCSGRQRTDSISYRQEPASDLTVCRKQDRKLELGFSLPTTLLGSDPVFLQCLYATRTGAAATVASTASIAGQHCEGFFSQAFPGASNAELELLHRQYAPILRRQIHRKVKASKSFNRGSANKASYLLEASIPRLTSRSSSKAYATTNFDRNLTVGAEFQWKAQEKQAKQSSKAGERRPHSRKQYSKAALNSAVSLDHQAEAVLAAPPPSQQAGSRLYTRCFSHTPLPVYCKQPSDRAAKSSQGKPSGTPAWTGASESTQEQEDKDKEGQMQGRGSQCLLQVKANPGGSRPGPTWQLRGQKAFSRQTQLRLQARAARQHAFSWQTELQHRLSKATVVKAKVQTNDKPQARGSLMYRLQVDHKDPKHFWSCSCMQDSSGLKIAIKTKLNAAKERTSSQKWWLCLTGKMPLFCRSLGQHARPFLQAEVNIPL